MNRPSDKVSNAFQILIKFYKIFFLSIFILINCRVTGFVSNELVFCIHSKIPIFYLHSVAFTRFCYIFIISKRNEKLLAFKARFSLFHRLICHMNNCIDRNVLNFICQRVQSPFFNTDCCSINIIILFCFSSRSRSSFASSERKSIKLTHTYTEARELRRSKKKNNDYIGKRDEWESKTEKKKNNKIKPIVFDFVNVRSLHIHKRCTSLHAAIHYCNCVTEAVYRCWVLFRTTSK